MNNSPIPACPANTDGDHLDRARGTFLGLAVGDALGTSLEFSRRDTRPLHTEMIGGGPFDLRPGEWTDDTAMALALAESLLCRRSFDPGDVMVRFLAWWREGRYSCTGECFGHWPRDSARPWPVRADWGAFRRLFLAP